jgi:hypothetical protein
MRSLLLLLAIPAVAPAQTIDLFNGKNLDGWEVVGDGVWTVRSDGYIVGQRDPRLPKSKYDPDQSWLYTKKEFGQYDLHVEWWVRLGGNSGVSIRDQSRAKYSHGPEADPHRTPSHIGYEIQISVGDRDPFPSGSVYLFDHAKTGFQNDTDWNSLDIESRSDMIRVKLNGHLVSESPGDPARSKVGPIGFQLHDRTTLAMFRNIRLRPVEH